MSIEKLRSSLNSDDLKKFDTTLSNFLMSNDVTHEIINYESPNTFMVKSEYNSYPKNGLIAFEDGKISDFAYC